MSRDSPVPASSLFLCGPSAFSAVSLCVRWGSREERGCSVSQVSAVCPCCFLLACWSKGHGAGSGGHDGPTDLRGLADWLTGPATGPNRTGQTRGTQNRTRRRAARHEEQRCRQYAPSLQASGAAASVAVTPLPEARAVGLRESGRRSERISGVPGALARVWAWRWA
jgi:hypothetical protein